jgi:low affinity Fe/Cu permease
MKSFKNSAMTKARVRGPKKAAPTPATQVRPGWRTLVNERFRCFAHLTSEMVGSPWSFIASIVLICGWAALGPIFGFSDTWQLVINTATTIITFLMVFLIQNTQNRDARAIHLKLDELLHAIKGARNHLIDLENLSEEELEKLHTEFEQLRKKAVEEDCRDESTDS